MKNHPALANSGSETFSIHVVSYLFASAAPLLPPPSIVVEMNHISMAGKRGGHDHMVELISVASKIEHGDIAIDLLDRWIFARLKMIFVRGRKSFDIVSAFTTHLTPLW